MASANKVCSRFLISSFSLANFVLLCCDVLALFFLLANSVLLYYDVPLQRKAKGSSAQGACAEDPYAQKAAKRNYLTLIGLKTDEANEAPDVEGRDVEGWVNNGPHLGKLEGAIQNVEVRQVNVSYFAVITFRASDSTILNITCWKDPLAQKILGCSMKDYYFFTKEDDLFTTEKIQMMTKLVNKRQDLVNFTVKDSYRQEKKYINLVDFKWLSE